MFKQNRQFLWAILIKVLTKSTTKMQCKFYCKHRSFKVERIAYTGGRKKHPQIPSTSYHTSLDRTNSSNENVFLACPRWKHSKPESLRCSFYCNCKTVLTSSNMIILFSVPQLWHTAWTNSVHHTFNQALKITPVVKEDLHYIRYLHYFICADRNF